MKHSCRIVRGAMVFEENGESGPAGPSLINRGPGWFITSEDEELVGISVSYLSKTSFNVSGLRNSRIVLAVFSSMALVPII